YFKRLRNLQSPAFNFLNVRALIMAKGAAPPGDRWTRTYSGEDGDVYENAEVLPRAFVPGRVRLVASQSVKEPGLDANAAFGPAFREIAANPDFRATAWVLSDREADAPGGDAAITAYRETTNVVSFDASVGDGADAWIVLSIVQDGGWSAETGRG